MFGASNIWFKWCLAPVMLWYYHANVIIWCDTYHVTSWRTVLHLSNLSSSSYLHSGREAALMRYIPVLRLCILMFVIVRLPSLGFVSKLGLSYLMHLVIQWCNIKDMSLFSYIARGPTYKPYSLLGNMYNTSMIRKVMKLYTETRYC